MGLVSPDTGFPVIEYLVVVGRKLVIRLSGIRHNACLSWRNIAITLKTPRLQPLVTFSSMAQSIPNAAYQLPP